MNLERGWASSAMVVWVPLLGRWQWSASGRGGMTMGGAKSEAEAWERARAAQKALERPLTPQGTG
jgi:hypothetical protein